MIDDLVSIEQLERIRRLIESGRNDMALAHIEAAINEREDRVRRFEEELFDNVPV